MDYYINGQKTSISYRSLLSRGVLWIRPYNVTEHLLNLRGCGLSDVTDVKSSINVFDVIGGVYMRPELTHPGMSSSLLLLK